MLQEHMTKEHSQVQKHANYRWKATPGILAVAFWLPFSESLTITELGNWPDNSFSVKMLKIQDGRFPMMAGRAVTVINPICTGVLSGASLSFLPSLCEVFIHHEKKGQASSLHCGTSEANSPAAEVFVRFKLQLFSPKIYMQFGKEMLGEKTNPVCFTGLVGDLAPMSLGPVKYLTKG